MLIANKLKLRRDFVIDLVAQETGIDFNNPQSATQLLVALRYLNASALIFSAILLCITDV